MIRFGNCNCCGREALLVDADVDGLPHELCRDCLDADEGAGQGDGWGRLADVSRLLLMLAILLAGAWLVWGLLW